MNAVTPLPNQKFSTKAAILFAVALVTLLSSFALLNPPANFSGEWKLNESKSELGQFPQFAPRKLKAAAKDTSATVERFNLDQSGQERSATETLSYGGSATESTVFGTMKKKSTVKWSDDAKTMTVNSTILFDANGQSNEIKVKEEWKLSDDGKTLTINSASASSFGENTMKMIFDKAQ